KLTLEKAWPDVSWESTDEKRRSTTVGVHLAGSVKDAPNLLVKALDDGLAENFAKYLVEQAGEANLIMSPQELAEWLQARLSPVTAKVQEGMSVQTAFEQEVAGNLGVFDTQAKQLKSIYAKYHDHAEQSSFDDAGPVDDIEGDEDGNDEFSD